jgi:hypothetical protein
MFLESSKFQTDQLESTPKANKVSLIQTDNKILNKKGKNLENESVFSAENILIFSSDKEDLLNKWIVVINYFMNK